MRLIRKYLNSACHGKIISEKLTRIIILLILPIWGLALGHGLISLPEGIKGVMKYQQLQDFKKSPDYENLIRDELSRSYNNQSNGLADISHISFNPFIWKEYGIERPTPYDKVTELTAAAEFIQIKRIQNLLLIPIYFILFIMMPWIIIRLVYWVRNANN